MHTREAFCEDWSIPNWNCHLKCKVWREPERVGRKFRLLLVCFLGICLLSQVSNRATDLKVMWTTSISQVVPWPTSCSVYSATHHLTKDGKNSRKQRQRHCSGGPNGRGPFCLLEVISQMETALLSLLLLVPLLTLFLQSDADLLLFLNC